MSGNNLTADGEFRYIIQWFNEWSELQREDFLPILVEYLTTENQEIYMNGVVQGMANAVCNDKPMSLFQCRIKLFKDWSKKWPEEFKIKLKEKVIELDPKVGDKLQEELKTNTPNGSASHEEVVQPVPEEVAVVQEEVLQNA